MNKLLLGALLATTLGAVTGSVVVMTGLIDVGADAPHSPLVHAALAVARERSIANRLADIKIPENFADPERTRRGAGNYAAMCVNCHLSPGASDSEIRRGLYPTPPNLSEKPVSLQQRDAVRDFWIIKHGIKASGMPAWSKGGMDDDSIWDLAAFLQKMPSLTPSSYEQLVAESDGHSHGGLDNHDHGHGDQHISKEIATPEKPAVKPHRSHSHSNHDHGKHPH